MRYTITGRNIKVTEGLKSSVTKKLSRLEKYFAPETEAKVALSVTHDDQKIEVTIPTKKGLIRAEEANNDMYASIDLVTDDIENQIKKFKNKLIDKKQSAPSFSALFMEEESDEDSEELKIVRTKKFAVKPMDPEEACLQMEMLGHTFYVFLNADTDLVSVVYKRKDGSYGLIEPEM
jgi:putative sigma-54 modulation protein